MSEEECIHGMNPAWCANCKGLKTPEEEATQEDDAVIDNIRSWEKR